MMTRGLFLLVVLGGSLTAADRELTGLVVDAQSGQPIVRAHVKISFYQPNQQGLEVTLLSDTDGSFRVTNIPEGGYQVSCEKAGYLPSTLGMSPMASRDGKPADSMVLRLTAQAAIEGTVLDDQGAPVENTFIQLVRQQVVNGRRQFHVAAGGGTDETGYFRLFGLQAGRYYIGITPHVNDVRRAKSMAYAPLYYPNTTEIAAAQPFDLKAGDEQQIRIRLPEPVPAHEIRGAVATAGTYVNVTLTRQPASQSPLPPSGETNWDAKTRTFRVSHVTPGMYLLTAGVQDGKNWLQASTMVTVGNADVGGIRLEPVDTGVDGTVRVEENAGQGRQVFYIMLQSQGSSNGAQVDADGKFHAVNLQPDTYRVVPQISGPQCVRSILQGGRDVRDGLVVGAEGATAPIEIVLTTHCGSVEATLAPSDPGPPANLTAVLLRKVGDELVLEKQGFAGGRFGDAAPRFLMQGITPGDYMLYAWPQDAQIEYANAEYMRQFASYGKAVTVTEDGKVSVALDKVLLSAAKN